MPGPAQIVRLAERADRLGWRLERARAGFVLSVRAGIVYGPAPWDDLVAFVAAVERERVEYDRRLISGKEPWEGRNGSTGRWRRG